MHTVMENQQLRGTKMCFQDRRVSGLAFGLVIGSRDAVSLPQHQADLAGQRTVLGRVCRIVVRPRRAPGVASSHPAPWCA